MLTTNLPSGYHRDMQLLKENLFEGIESIKECLYMTGFMLEKIEVNKSILEDERYQYMFSVELVNELVSQGKSFRDAYREVGNMIEKGKYKPNKRLHHTHEGSLGNLMNDKIEEMMQEHIKYFRLKYAYIDSSIKNLVANN
jgi:argininosuccinate lyase